VLDVDAYDTGARMGVAAMSTMSSGRSPQHVRASYTAMGESTAAYAAGRARDTHLSMSARAASGDAHFQRVFGQQGSEVAQAAVTADSVAAQAQGRGRFFAVTRCRAAHRRKAHSALRSVVC
jgi:hypothetical protein